MTELEERPKKKISGRMVAIGGVVVAAALGLWFLLKPLKKGIPGDLRITSYTNLTTGVTMEPTSPLQVSSSDQIRVDFSYKYYGPALSGTYHVAIWHKGLIDPHDEVVATDKSFTVIDAEKETLVEDSVTMALSALSDGKYGLYIKIMSIPKEDIFTPFYVDVIVVGAGGDGLASGSITSKWVNKGSLTRQGMPFPCQPDSQTFEVGVAYKNNSSVDFIIGAEVVVTRPDGSTIAPSVDWAGISPGEVLEVEYNISKVDQAGEWGIDIRLLGDSDQELDSFHGTVLNVASLNAQITEKWVNKGSLTRQAMPLSCEADSQTFEVGVSYKNNSSISFIIGAEVVVTRPDGSTIAPSVDWAGIDPGETLSVEYNIARVDQAGQWGIDIALVKEGGEVLGSFRGTVLNASEEEEEVPGQDVRNLQIIDYDREVNMGDYCRLTVEFEYIGKACSGTVRAALGNAGWAGFDEVKYDQNSISIPQSMTWTRYSVDLSIPTSGMSAGYYDLYAKIGGGAPGLIGPFLYDVVEVVGAVPDPEIRNFRISSYDSQVEVGDYCQVRCSFEYRGPARSGSLRAAIGNAGTFGFDEIVYDIESISVPETSNWKAYTVTAQIYISTAISAGVYDIYAKITGALPDVITPTKYNVVTVKAPVDFYVYITDLPSGWTDATYWAAYYYDPGTGSWIGTDAGVRISSAIKFNDVMPGGSINASLWHPDKDWSYSRTSPTFNPEQGKRYDFRFSTNTIVPH